MIIVGVIVGFFMVSGLWFFQNNTTVSLPELDYVVDLGTAPAPQETKQKSAQKIITTERSVLLNVPFTSQAPFANWDDIVFQNACEEASIIMAMRWVNNQSLTQAEANFEIATISFGIYFSGPPAGKITWFALGEILSRTSKLVAGTSERV